MFYPLQWAECQEQISLKQHCPCPHNDICFVCLFFVSVCLSFPTVKYYMGIRDIIFICFIFAADNESYSESKEIIYISRKMLTRWWGACKMRISSLSALFFFTSFPRYSQMAKLRLCSPLHTLIIFDGHPAAESQGGHVFMKWHFWQKKTSI